MLKISPAQRFIQWYEGRKARALAEQLAHPHYHEDKFYQRKAMALAKCRHPEAISFLCTSVRDSRFDVAVQAAAAALGKIGGAAAEAALIEALEKYAGSDPWADPWSNRDPWTVKFIILALAQINTPSAQNALLKASSDMRNAWAWPSSVPRWSAPSA